jgi:hypothetical protein
METLLDQLGLGGWNLLSAVPAGDELMCMFRRVYVVGRVEIVESPGPEVEEVATETQGDPQLPL